MITTTTIKKNWFMRHAKQFVFVLATLLMSNVTVNAQTMGIYESYAIVNINGAGNTFYDLTAATGNPDFSAANLGTFNQTQTLVLAGAQNKTFKCSGGNVTSGNTYYRIWLQGGSAPSYTTLSPNMGFVSNDAGGCGGNQTWQTNTATVNLLQGLGVGTYNVEVYTDATGTPATATTASFIATFVVNSVFGDNFNRASLTPGGSPQVTYTNTNTGAGTSATSGSSFLLITNGNPAGRSYTTAPLSSYASPFNTTLSSNPGLVTWTFNARSNRTSTLSGLDAGNYGIAAVLTGTNANLSLGNGYAVVYGGNTFRGYRLVSYTGGLFLNSSATTIISSGANDFSAAANYVSIRVTYNPASNTWQLFSRDDGASAWADPSSGVTTQIGSNTVNSTYTGTAMSVYGYLWNYSTGATQNGQFDNFNVQVSINPSLSTNGTSTLSFGSQNVSTNSSSQTFNLSGTFLTGFPGNITVSAPSTDFQVSNNNSSWGSTTTIAYSSATLTSAAVYVRFTPQSAGAKSGNVTFSGGGVSSPPTIAVSGTGTIAAPVATAGTSISGTGFTANWGSVTGATSYRLDVATSFPTTVEDFNDGEFTSSPTWSGSTSSYAIETASTLTNGTASTDGLYLGSSTTAGNTGLTITSTEASEWTFSLGSTNFAGSSTNYFGVILMSTAAVTDVTSSFNGYYLKVGVNSTPDPLELWKSTGVTKTQIGSFPSSPDFSANALQAGLNIRVTRSNAGVFELFYATGFTYPTAPTTSAGTLTDATYSASSFFGVYTAFGSPSSTRRVYIDNIVIGASNFVSGYNDLTVAGTSQSVTVPSFGTYIYRVRATDGANFSSNSNIITVTIANPSTADYRSKAAGPANYTASGSWEYDVTGSGNWINATAAPTSGSNVNIQSGHTITLDANASINTPKTLTVAGILDASTNVLSGTGAFSLSSGATLKSSSATGVSGSITTSTKSFSSAANYEFLGAATGTFTTTPTALTVNNLNINRSGGVTMSQAFTVNGTLTLTSGSLDLNALTLTMSSGAAQSISGNSANTFNITGAANSTLALTGGASHVVTLSNFGTGISANLITGANVNVQLNSNTQLDCAGNGTSTSMLTVLGTFTLNSATSSNIANVHPPFYGTGSTLVYNANYGRFSEWNATSGPGYPYNVTVTGSTTLDVVNGVNSYKKAAGNLTVNSGSTFSIPALISGSGGVGIEFLGDIVNDGTISLATGANTTSQRLKAVNFTNGNSNTSANTTLSGTAGGDLELTGNYLDNANFTANARAVFFTGTGTQTISGTATAPFNIDYIVSTKASGSIQLGVDLLTAGPNGGNAITLTSATDIVDLNGKTFTLGTSGVASVISGSGMFKGGGASKMIFNGSGAFGTVTFDQTTPGTTDLLSNLTVNRTSTGGITLGSNLSVSTDATLTAGTITLGSNNMTIGASGTITVSSPDATKMIIASGGGELRKTFTGTGSFLYPVGDNVSTVEYSPITLNFTAGSFSSAYAGVNVTNSKQGSNASATDYINRFWTISASGITSPTYTATAVYADGDIAGTEANLYGGLYAASTWNCMGPVTTASNTISSSLTQFGDITAGDVESMGCCINPSAGGGIDAVETICSGGDPAAFTSTSLPTGHAGTLEYQWQSSTTSAVAGFSDIFGANSTTYDIPSGLTTTSWYKRLARVTCKTTWVGAASSNVLQITVNQPPTASAAGSDQNGSGTCGLTTVTLAANAPSVGVGAWSIISGAGGSFSDASDEGSDFSGTAGTSYTLRWTITNAPCAASTDDVDITFNINPTTSNAGSAISICSIGVASLSANTPTNGSGVWSITSGPSSNLSQFSNTASPTSTFTPDGGTGSYVLTWTISNSPCTASSSNVTVTVVSGTAGEWIGGISTDWADVNNWCGSVPNSSTDVIIPNGAAFYPIITSGTEAAKSITIASAASLQVNGGSLTLASSGDVANDGALTVGSSGTLDMVNNQITGGGTVTINGTFKITKSLGFSGGASTAIASSITSITLGSASTIDYSSSSSQTITVENYANLSNSGNGNRTFPTGNVGVSGTFTTGSGDYTIGNSTVTFNGSSAQSIPAPTVSSGGNYNNLTLNNAAGATLSANTSIKGSLTLTSGAFDVNGKTFTLLSTATQTARIAAITGGSYVGDVTVERYVPAGPTGWATIGMPVTGATLAQWNDDIATSGYTGSTYGAGIFHSVYTYDETVGGLASAAASYVTATNSTNNVDGKRGYYVFLDVSGATMSAKTLDVTGAPLTGNQDLNVTFTTSGGTAEDGWNLVNNPYCSSIDWLSPNWSKTNMDNAIYIYDADNNQYVGKAGGVSYNGGNEFIGSSQSFMVHANATSPFLQATEDVKTATNANFYKASSVTTGVLRLQLDGLNGTYNDETVFHIASGATSNFDADFDAYKLYSFDPAAPNISSKVNGIEYVVNTVDNLVSNLDLPVRVNVNTAGSYTINFIGLQEFANLTCFSLEDKLTNTWVDLKIDSTYTFTSQIDTASANPRFVLHFGVETIVPQISPSATTVSIPGSTSVDFTNLTTGANSYSWDFGDGSPVENTVSPSHTYSAVGVYTVTLTAGNTAGCSQTSTVLITVDDVTGINTLAAEESILIGKDAQGVYANYNFKNSTLVKLSIYNALGEQIGLTKNKTVQSKGQFYVETSGLAKGVYTIELLVNNKKITRKLML